MTENCDPCESGQISNLIAFSKRPICSALLPHSPKRVLNQRVQNSTKTLLHGKGEDAHDQDWICEPKYPHIKLKWKKRLFLHSSCPIVSSTDLMSVEAASKTKNTPSMLSYSLSRPFGNFWSITSKLLLAWQILPPSSNDTPLPVIYTTSLTLSPQFSKFGLLIGKFLGSDPGPKPKMITIHLGQRG